MNETTDFERRVSSLIEQSIATKQSMLSNRELISTAAKVNDILVRALKRGNKLLIFGNGGSAADAQHIAAEFVGRFAFDHPALPAFSLISKRFLCYGHRKRLRV
jgi:D-sedoheptulose 7-phosphate isomerase